MIRRCRVSAGILLVLASVLSGCGTSADPPTGQEQVTFTDSAGTAGSYLLFTDEVDTDQPVGLVIRLHGDGEGTYVDEFDDWETYGLLPDLAQRAAAYNMVLLAPKAPDEHGNATWWEDAPTHRVWLGELLDTHLSRDGGSAGLAIDPDQVVWVGYSGGAQLLTEELLAEEPHRLGAGALMLGGGEAPESVSQLPGDAQREQAHLQWVVGENDIAENAMDGFDAVAASHSGYEFYRDQGYAHATRTVVPEVDHYDLDQVTATDDFLASIEAE